MMSRIVYRIKNIAILISLNLLLSIHADIYSQGGLHQQINALIDSVSEINLTEHIQWLQQPGGHNSRVNFTPGNDSAANYIYRQFSKMPGLSSVDLDTFFIQDAQEPFNTKPLVNVVATFLGKTEPEKYYILGAHLDASASNMDGWDTLWHTIDAPGADDNATGIAAIMEIARIISNPEHNFQNDYTLKFIAFGSEEAGPAYSWYHHGSRHYAQNAKLNNHQILGMISIDLIGFNDNYNYTAITANENSVIFAEQFLTANDQFNIDLIIEGPPFSSGSWSDHLSFWTEGYPAVLMLEHAPPWDSSFYYIKNPYLHTSYDTLGYLNMELVKKVTQLNLATFASLSSQLTDIDDRELLLPNGLSLAQNYPNPFNPTTKIKFTLPYNVISTEGRNLGDFSPQASRNDNIRLIVYDVLGNEIAVLIDEQKPAGTYEVEFNARSVGRRMTSGVYFYSLSAGEKLITKKMLLLK
jgi:hypothetical protein